MNSRVMQGREGSGESEEQRAGESRGGEGMGRGESGKAFFIQKMEACRRVSGAVAGRFSSGIDSTKSFVFFAMKLSVGMMIFTSELLRASAYTWLSGGDECLRGHVSGEILSSSCDL